MKRKELIAEWIKALRSGNYKQGKTQLLIDDKYCCLGVACDLIDPKDNTNWTNEQLLPSSIAKKLGITDAGTFKSTIKYRGRNYSDLTELNDNGCLRFKTIARIIEEQMEANNFRKN